MDLDWTSVGCPTRGWLQLHEGLSISRLELPWISEICCTWYLKKMKKQPEMDWNPSDFIHDSTISIFYRTSF